MRRSQPSDKLPLVSSGVITPTLVMSSVINTNQLINVGAERGLWAPGAVSFWHKRAGVATQWSQPRAPRPMWGLHSDQITSKYSFTHLEPLWDVFRVKVGILGQPVLVGLVQHHRLPLLASLEFPDLLPHCSMILDTIPIKMFQIRFKRRDFPDWMKRAVGYF